MSRAESLATGEEDRSSALVVFQCARCRRLVATSEGFCGASEDGSEVFVRGSPVLCGPDAIHDLLASPTDGAVLCACGAFLGREETVYSLDAESTTVPLRLQRTRKPLNPPPTHYLLDTDSAEVRELQETIKQIELTILSLHDRLRRLLGCSSS